MPRTIGYRETRDAERNCSACSGVSVPNSTITPFHFYHEPRCPLYRELSSTLLSDRERFNRFGPFSREYRPHELTLIADSGQEMVKKNGSIVGRVNVYGTRGELGFSVPNWEWLGRQKATATVTP